jgi:hypothetical protein
LQTDSEQIASIVESETQGQASDSALAVSANAAIEPAQTAYLEQNPHPKSWPTQKVTMSY